MHLDDTLLIQYALGILDPKESSLVDEALSASAKLRSQLREIQESLHTLALAETPVQSDPHLRDHVLGSIEPSKRFEGFTRRFAELVDLGEKEAKRLLEKIDRSEAGEWKSSILPGVSILKFRGGPRIAAATCGLISVKPETIFPRHRHRGQETVLVLQGRARENSGRILRPGDLMRSEPESEHAFATLGPEPFVFAVVLTKDNRWLIFRSLLDRLLGMQRLPHKPHE